VNIAKQIIYIWIFILAGLFVGCAIRKGPPEGGAKDETPPKVTGERPANGSVNFNQRRIVLSFDEYVELNNAFQEVQMTPATSKNPVLNLSGRNIYIDTAELHLQPNTTYTIQFGNAIKDINEGNILSGCQYVFSTGPYIDSMFIQGNVVAADSAQKLDKVRVQLYPEGNDTGLYKGRPSYMAKADASGYFKVGNLPKSKFHLFALEDKNDNYILDQGERVGYVPGLINTDSGLTLPTVVLFPANPKELKFSTNTATNWSLKLKANMPVDSIHILAADNTPLAGYPLLNTEHDSLVFWFTHDLGSGTVIKTSASSGNYRVSAETKTSVNPRDTGSTMYMVLDQAGDNPVMYNTPLIMHFTEPVVKIDYRKIHFSKEDSTALQGIRFRYMDSSHLNLATSYEFGEDDKYRIAFGKGAFTSLRGRVQDTIAERLWPA
jgi:hypothetical protein